MAHSAGVGGSAGPAIGGLGVALARLAMAGGFGLEADLRACCGCAAGDWARLYSESNSRFLVTVAPEAAGELEEVLAGQPFTRVGKVRKDDLLVVTGISGAVIIRERIEPLRRSWQATLEGM